MGRVHRIFWALLLLSSAGGAADPDRLEELARRTLPAAYEEGKAQYGVFRFIDGQWHPATAGFPSCLVLCIHGLDEPGGLWDELAPALVKQDHDVAELRYPNDQPVRASAAFLHTQMQALRTGGVETLIIVAHSMGGLVSREFLSAPERAYASELAAGSVPHVLGLIMVGTPNHGSHLARFRALSELRDQWSRFIRGDGHLLGGLVDGSGEAGQDLLPGSEFLETLNRRRLPEGMHVTIIAGIASPLTPTAVAEASAGFERAAPEALKPLAVELRDNLAKIADGIGDGAVPLESTHLRGVTDHVTVRGDHIGMLHNLLPGLDRVPPAIPLIVARIGRWLERD